LIAFGSVPDEESGSSLIAKLACRLQALIMRLPVDKIFERIVVCCLLLVADGMMHEINGCSGWTIPAC